MTSLFQNDPKNTQNNEAKDGGETPSLTNNNNSASYLETLVGPGKKFASVEDLAKSKIDADNFIETLKKENQETRQELKVRMTLEDFWEKTQSRNAQQHGAPSNNEDTPSRLNGNERGVDTSKNVGVPREEINALVREALAKELSRSAQLKNIEQTKAELEATLGKEYETHIRNKMNELGVTPQFLDNLAASSPKAFKALLGINAIEGNKVIVNNSTPPNSNSRSPLNGDTNFSGTRDETYYQNLKASNPKEYFSAKVQSQKHRDALALGEKFFK